MCGIFGVLTEPAEQVDTAVLTALGRLNSQRGNLGFGAWLGDGKGAGQAVRFPHPFIDATSFPLENSRIALAHIRAPTGGQSKNLAELHPFQHENLWLAHNGLLLNHRDFPAWRLQSEVNVDSLTILGGIIAHLAAPDLPEAICQTVGQLEGQQACWLWDEAAHHLYLWRVMSPIYVQSTPTRFIFSSLKPPIVSDPTLLTEGQLYRLHYPTLSLETVGTFPFYSPYQ